MLARQRQERILEKVRADGAARVSELIELLDVSDMTIRRDLEVLASRGLVARVHGGATEVAPTSTYEPGFTVKSTLQAQEKLAVARAAAGLVEPGAAVAISAGTTTFALARELLAVPDLTVVTNSVPVAQLFHEAPRKDRTLVLTGGVRTPSDALVGPVSVAALRTLHTDWLFLGVHGLDLHAGLTTPNLAEAETNRALISCARRLAVVTDSTKWNVVGLCTIATLDEVDVLVTDDGLDPAARAALDEQVGRIVTATAGSANTGTTVEEVS